MYICYILSTEKCWWSIIYLPVSPTWCKINPPSVIMNLDGKFWSLIDGKLLNVSVAVLMSQARWDAILPVPMIIYADTIKQTYTIFHITHKVRRYSWREVLLLTCSVIFFKCFKAIDIIPLLLIFLAIIPWCNKCLFLVNFLDFGFYIICIWRNYRIISIFLYNNTKSISKNI